MTQLTWYEREKSVRHAVRARSRVIGGGDSISTWCGISLYVLNGVKRARAAANCIDCIAQMRPDA